MRQGVLAWRIYDEQFRLRQAICPASWSQINNDLWWRCIQVKDTQTHQPSQNTSNYACNDYNKGNCTGPNSKFAHRCAKCNLFGHPEVKCQRNTDTDTSSNAPFRGCGLRRNQGSTKTVARLMQPYKTNRLILILQIWQKLRFSYKFLQYYFDSKLIS